MKANEQERKEKIEKAIENGTIHERQRIKNLPELCRIIGIENSKLTGNAKTSLMKELDCHCKYIKDGQAFIIKSIITNPTHRKKNSGGAHNIKHRLSVNINL